MIIDGSGAAPVVLDGGYTVSERDPFASRSYRQILRAVGDLRQDIAMVTGAIRYLDIRGLMVDSPAARDERLAAVAAGDPAHVPALIRGGEAFAATVAGGPLPHAIVVGSIASSELIRGIVGAGLFDEARSIEGHEEAYALKEISGPVPGLPGAERVLAIAGADARGTVFGIYELSQRIGVSPYYWMSDVPVAVREAVDSGLVLGEALVVDSPAVRFRGIFINDEDNSIMGWAARKFPTEHGTPEVNYYRHVFEMILRLRMNTLWPAMHPVSTAFNAAEGPDGVPVNAHEAAEYGVVIGMSHCETMLRSNPGEWEPWYRAHRSEYGVVSPAATSLVEGVEYSAAQRAAFSGVSLEADSAYDFTLNRDAIIAYWRERLETYCGIESIITLGIRGIHDGDFHCAELYRYEGATTAEKHVSFMLDVLRTQRALIDEVYGAGASRHLPQVLIVYKEIAEVYNAGLAAYMATPEFEDVMLMWAEDNYGYLRQVPNATEAARSGGAGVYYHSSYFGSPRSYLWLNSVNLSLMSEELHRAYATGMRSEWILNVGDIKPGDVPTEFFARLAWNPQAYTDVTVHDALLVDMARRDWHLDVDAASDVADALLEYSRLVGVKRPEFFTAAYHDFDLPADEADCYLARVNAMVERLAAVYATLDADTATAFYEQVYYNVLSMRDIATAYVYWWKNLRAAADGDTERAQAAALVSQRATERIQTRIYDFNGCADGKWTGFMTWWGIMATNPVDREDWKVDIIQRDEYVFPDGTLSLAPLVDDRVPAVPNSLADADSACVQDGLVDTVVIEAEDADEMIPGFDGSSWTLVRDLGAHGDVMKTIPDVGRSAAGEGARLVFKVHIESAGAFRGEVRRIPTLSEGIEADGSPRSCDVAVRVNGGAPFRLAGNRLWMAQAGNSFVMVDRDNPWAMNMLRGYEPLEFEFEAQTGWNTIEVERVDPSIMIDRIAIEALMDAEFR